MSRLASPGRAERPVQSSCSGSPSSAHCRRERPVMTKNAFGMSHTRAAVDAPVRGGCDPRCPRMCPANHRHDPACGRELGDLPGQQMRVVGERVDVGFGLQKVGQSCTPGEGSHGLAALAQRPYERAGHFAVDRSDGAGQQQRLGDVCEHGLHLLRQCLPGPGGQAAAAQVLLQWLAGVLVLPVPAQGQIEGRRSGWPSSARASRMVRTTRSKSLPVERARSIRIGRIRPPGHTGGPTAAAGVRRR